MKKHFRFVKPVFAILILAGLATAAYFTRDRWLPPVQHAEEVKPDDSPTKDSESPASTGKIVLSDQAIDNLGLTAKAVHAQTYWKTIQVPGMVVDRPGRSDRDIISPIAGVIAAVNYFPGDTVRPGDVLFTIRHLSESLHQTQSDLFKATQDIKLAKAQRQRLLTAGGAIAEARIIEAENQVTRMEVAAKSYREELVHRGLTPDQIDGVSEGTFVTEIAINVPTLPRDVEPMTTGSVAMLTATHLPEAPDPTYEVQELQIEFGQQVQAGQTLCLLANHQLLAIEGRAFRDEISLLERTIQEEWPVEVDFHEDELDWPPLDQAFYIRRIANTIDPVNRTFGFLIPIENQSRVISNGDRTQMLWRFRPGQKVRVLVRTERLDDVFVLPSDAVTRDLAEAFVFTQNVNTFERKSVRILSEDRQHTVVANDGLLLPGSFVAQNSAAQLNRMTKSQTGNDLPEGYHIHADGSLHKNEAE